MDSSGKLKSTIKASLQKQLTEYLSQIQFHYVPAIKDKWYFSHLFGELQQTLWKAKTSVIDEKKNDFQHEIQKETSVLMEEFKQTLSQKKMDYEPVFQLPENLVDLFRTLQVQTGAVELSQRGDGVQAKLIPEILNYISIKERSFTSRTVRSDVQSKKYFMWGFEEPENSYEYRNAQLLAERFRTKFVENAQIFITTHSFNFISIEGDNVSKYRVWRDEDISASRIARIKVDKSGALTTDDTKLNDSYRLNEELGVFHLNSELERIFVETEKIKALLHKKVSELETNERILFVEDKYDQIYKIAWLKLNGVSFSKETVEQSFLDSADFKIKGLESAGSVAGLMRSKNASIFESNRMVGLFDFDKEGSENFHHLKREKYWNDDALGDKVTGFYRKRNDHPCWYAMLLPIPERLDKLADLDHDNFANYVEIENLLSEQVLKKGNFVQTKSIVGTEYLKVKESCKSDLWEALVDLNVEEFEDFRMLFDTFRQLTAMGA